MMSYLQYFVLTGAIGLVLFSIFFVIIGLSIKQHTRKRILRVDKELRGEPYNSKLLVASTICFVIGGVLFASHFSFYSGGGILPWYVSGILLTIFTLLYWGVISGFIRNVLSIFRIVDPTKTLFQAIEDGDDSELDYFTPEDPFQGRLFNPKTEVKKQVLKQGLPILFLCILGFGFMWMTADVCFTMEPITYSNRFLRYVQKDPCDGKTICHLYLTVTPDTKSSIMVIFHTTVRFSNPLVKFDEVSRKNISEYRVSVEAQEREITLDNKKRWIYYGFITNLDPGKKYYFVVGNGGIIHQHSSERMFTTMDDITKTNKIHFVTGGDWGHTENTVTLVKMASQLDPDFISIGGDLAYDNGIKSCYRRWDHWLFDWEKFSISPSQRTIPLLTAIGNHEVGGFEMKRSDDYLYMYYFVHESLNTGKSPSELPTFRRHYVGNTLFLVLDSNILEKIDGRQTEFIEKELNHSYNSALDIKYRLALYHVPLYPAVRSPNNRISEKLRKYWKPLFDKYRLDVGLENHDHAYKRTKLIDENGFGPNGTLYIGDGAMGVKARRPAENRDYIAHSYFGEFMIDVNMTYDNISFEAIDVDGDVFDKYVYPIRN